MQRHDIFFAINISQFKRQFEATNVRPIDSDYKLFQRMSTRIYQIWQCSSQLRLDYHSIVHALSSFDALSMSRPYLLGILYLIHFARNPTHDIHIHSIFFSPLYINDTWPM
eukprot:55320_1